MKHRFLTLSLAVLLLAAFFVCPALAAKKIKVTKVKLNKAAITLNVGESFRLKSTVSPAKATVKKVKWASGNKKVVTVKNGLLTGVGQGTAAVTATATDGSGKKAVCKVTVTKASEKQKEPSTFSITSKINGKTITAEAGISAGIYSLKRYNPAGGDITIPYPPTWSGGKLVQNYTEKASAGYYYHFKASTGDEKKQLMNDYMQALENQGFTRTDERILTNMWYHFSKNGKGDIIIKSKDTYTIQVFMPFAYSFDLGDTGVVNTFRVSSLYKQEESYGSKHRFSVSGFDGSFDGGLFSLFLSPQQYKKGSRITLNDFLSQSNAGTSSSLYFCAFRGDRLDEKLYSTLNNFSLYAKNSAGYFKALTVEVLRKDSAATVLSFYCEVDAGNGACHQLEGIINVVTEEEEEQGGGKTGKTCSKCNGKGYTSCTSCTGKGERRCSLCGGDGKKISPITHKQELCTRCHGRGKQDCSFCTNGKKKCSQCGGTGVQ